MGRVTRRPLAEDDLFELWLHIAREDPVAADRLLDRIEATLRRLADHPRSGRARLELMVDLRSAPVGAYVLFHLPLADGIELVRVLHGARDIEAVFERIT